MGAFETCMHSALELRCCELCHACCRELCRVCAAASCAVCAAASCAVPCVCCCELCRVCCCELCRVCCCELCRVCAAASCAVCVLLRAVPCVLWHALPHPRQAVAGRTASLRVLPLHAFPNRRTCAAAQIVLQDCGNSVAMVCLLKTNYLCSSQV